MEQEKKLSPEEQAAQANTAQEDGQELSGEELGKAAGGWDDSPTPKYHMGDRVEYQGCYGSRGTIVNIIYPTRSVVAYEIAGSCGNERVVESAILRVL